MQFVKYIIIAFAIWEGSKLLYPSLVCRVKQQSLILRAMPVVDLTNQPPGAVAAVPGQRIMKDGQLLMIIPLPLEYRMVILIDLLYVLLMIVSLLGGVACILGVISMFLMTKFSSKLPATNWAVRLDSLISLSIWVSVLMIM